MKEPATLHMLPDSARDVLAFWFDTDPAAGSRTTDERARRQQMRGEWFIKNDAFDALCAERFALLVEAALLGELDDWNASAEGTLARILLLDQFPRNIFRGSAKSFAGDEAALAATLGLLARGALSHLTTLEQSFALMPLMHSEDMAVQQEGVLQFEALAKRDPRLESSADFARRHRDVIARFGRFPHRNQATGRESTVDETEFLQQPGSSF